MMSSQAPIVVARDAGFARRGYRSFEFATFSVFAGEVLAVLATAPASARDLLLAVAGLVPVTSGSLIVGDVELGSAERAAMRLGRRRAVATSVGLGMVSGVADVEGTLTVEETLAHERSAKRHPMPAGDVAAAPGEARRDVIDELGEFRLATNAGHQIERLGPLSRARLSCALALCRARDVALVDLCDPFLLGLTCTDETKIVAELRERARRDARAVIVATTEPAVGKAADRVCALDLDAAELLLRR